MFEQVNDPITKEPNMSDRSEPISFVDKTNRAAVVAVTLSRACRPQRTFRAAFVAELSGKQAGGQ
jgi:hypothetical protein